MKRKVLGIIVISIVVLNIINIIFNNYVNRSYDKSIPILAYHVVCDNPTDDMHVSTNNFNRQMKFLYNHHFRVLTLEELESFKKGEKSYPGKKVVITFDDGSESYYTKALPILEKYGFASTNFIITSKINQKGYLTDEEIKKLKENKLVRLEGHSRNLHQRENANSEDYQLYSDDLKSNKDYQFKYYAYPFGISNDEYVKALKDNDIKLAFKYAPSHWMNENNDNYNIPRVPVYNSTAFYKFVLKVLIKR